MFNIGKMMFVSVLALAQVCPLVASAGTQWVRDDLKSAYLVPNALVKISVQAVHADDDYWDRLMVEVTYGNPNVKDEFSQLQQRYPKYQISRPVVSAAGNFWLSIPAIGVSQEVKAMPGVDGPYMNFDVFLNKERGDAIRKALSAGNPQESVKVTASATAAVPTQAVVEHIELGHEYCDRLVHGSGTVFEMMKNFADVVRSTSEMKIELDSTRESLEHSLILNCLELSPLDRANVDSFRKLLAVRLTEKSGPARIVGETRRDAIVDQKFDLQFDFQRDVR